MEGIDSGLPLQVQPMAFPGSESFILPVQPDMQETEEDEDQWEYEYSTTETEVSVFHSLIGIN